MAITLISPTSAGAIGPGTWLNAFSTIQGVVGQWYWVYEIQDFTGNMMIQGAQRVTFAQQLQTFVGTESKIAGIGQVGHGNSDDGQPVTVDIWLYDNNGIFQDFGSFPVRSWTATLNLYKMNYQYFQQQAAGGGFTSADRAQLHNIYLNDSKFPYVATAQHPPQAGNVTIFLQTGTIAIAYSVVQFPPSPPQSSGEPVYYYNLGFITPRIGSTAYKSTRISFANGFLVLPPTTTNLGVTLLGGTSIILTEYAQAPLGT